MSKTASFLAAQGKTGTKGWEARVSTLQHAAIVKASAKHGLTHDDLYHYVGTGDAAHLTPDAHAKLAAIVKAAKSHMPNESQVERIWPRKVAAVLLDSLPRD